jgi:hypothetical protein
MVTSRRSSPGERPEIAAEKLVVALSKPVINRCIASKQFPYQSTTQ